jgi:hypothetical protein
MINQYKLPLLNLTFDNATELRRTKILFIIILITTATFMLLFLEALLVSSEAPYIPITLFGLIAIFCF